MFVHFSQKYFGEFIRSCVYYTFLAFKYGMTKLEWYHFAGATKARARKFFVGASDRVTERDDRCVEIYAIDSNGAE